MMLTRPTDDCADLCRGGRSEGPVVDTGDYVVDCAAASSMSVNPFDKRV